ncbi:MAG TPA: hypothetical protein VHO84_15625, partial [Syntrophorhabdaceae bacterium]|nr:hypothetical protein [Syntrophorhabdaceae bacterium]
FDVKRLAKALSYAIWLRWDRIELGSEPYSTAQEGYCHKNSGGPLLVEVLRSLQVEKNSTVLEMGVGRNCGHHTQQVFFTRSGNRPHASFPVLR